MWLGWKKGRQAAAKRVRERARRTLRRGKGTAAHVRAEGGSHRGGRLEQSWAGGGTWPRRTEQQGRGVGWLVEWPSRMSIRNLQASVSIDRVPQAMMGGYWCGTSRQKSQVRKDGGVLARPWRRAGEAVDIRLARPWRRAGEAVEACWRGRGDMLARPWRRVGEAVEACWRGRGYSEVSSNSEGRQPNAGHEHGCRLQYEEMNKNKRGACGGAARRRRRAGGPHPVRCQKRGAAQVCRERSKVECRGRMDSLKGVQKGEDRRRGKGDTCVEA